LDEQELLSRIYADFNARRMESVLARMHPDVEWPNGMEGGSVLGVEAVRAYWTRQWAMLDPHVEPVEIRQDDAGRYVVEVHQTVRDLQGTLLVDTRIRHAYRIRNQLIERMDIKPAGE
jgi:hypothetical protein